ncbi:MAG TPA: transcription termination factor Rho [Mycobacterium sp.]|nr:transcription termination factor Rho [Mycobacterium sp.]
MTETDLFTAEGSTEQDLLPKSLSTPETPSQSAPEVSSPGAGTLAGVDDAAVSAPEPSSAPAATASPEVSLSAMVLPELRAMANRVGVKGASGMRKSELIAAIRDASGKDGNGGAEPKAEQPTNGAANGVEPAAAEPVAAEPAAAEPAAAEADAPEAPRRRERRGASRGTGAPAANGGESDEQAEPRKQSRADDQAEQSGGRRDNARNDDSTQARGDDQGGDQQNRGGGDDDERGGRRGRRFRDRRRRGERGAEGGPGGGGDAELREDDVVQPVAGILDVLDNYAFVRTSGYLAGPNDVYVSMNMVRKNGLRRGDAVTGAVRVARDVDPTNQRQKFNPLVRLDSVNGGPVEEARNRPDFTKLTPLYPNQRLRLETTGDMLTTRIIDLIMPIGKGQRALIVSPPKAGKTMILQAIANAITVNNPECHLMVVLIDERPEEVTDMQRSVKGEVIASTFDRPPSDHTQAAELAIERAKRLVEQGKDVVVLLDSITRLGRAYNNASPASGRILSGGVDSTALYPPKRFLGAARNIEHGGSLTIIATAMVETGSTGDTVIFEEFKGTGNAELKLDRKIAERRVFPAVDVNPSGTRKDELLLSTDEFAIVHKLRRLLSGLDSHQAIDLLMSQLRKTKNNYEFLVQVSKTTPGMDHD